jgi:invasion protein IalB
MQNLKLCARIGAFILAAPLAMGLAVAQDKKDAAPDGDLSGAWVKVCTTNPKNKKELCLINQEQRTRTGQLVSSVALREITGEARKLMVVAVPPGMLLQPGLRVQIDKGKQRDAKYTICFANACYAEIVITAAFIAEMKKGNTLQLTALDREAKPVPFRLTLAGFTKAYDGVPLTPEDLAKKKREIQMMLRQRAEKARKRLVDEQRKLQQE